MSVLERVRSILPGTSAGPEAQTYECRECGNVFESMKDAERAKCMECLSADVEPVES